jgi:D-alanyl-D-alanine carboxypeptidase
MADYARVRHPLLVPLLDWGAGKDPFVVRADDPGPWLSARQPLGLPLGRQLAIVADLAAALGALHSAGLAHGALRPDMVRWRSDGTVSLVDAGIAALGGIDSDFRYGWRASPEPTPDDDVYALGILLYQLLTGRIPSVAATAAETFAIRSAVEPPPPSVFRSDLPRSVDTLALHLLAPSSADRLTDVAEIERALSVWAIREPLTDDTPSPPAVAEQEAGRGWTGWRSRIAVRGLSMPAIGASAVTSIGIAALMTVAFVGAGHAARLPLPGSFNRAVHLPSETVAARSTPTATYPVTVGLPPPVVVTSTAALSNTLGVTRTATGVLSTSFVSALTGTGALTASRPVSQPAPAPNPDSFTFMITRTNPIPETYVPADLGSIDGLVKAPRGAPRLRRAILDPFRRLVEGMRAAGLEPIVVGAYRTLPELREQFGALVATNGQAGAEKLAPKPGLDPHQLGTVIDFVSASQSSTTSDRFNESPEGKWLLANAPKYGFVQAAPAGKDSVLGYKPAPWQYRYVGDLAFDIASRGQTLEEYLAARR